MMSSGISLYILQAIFERRDKLCVDETIHKDDSEKKITHSLVIDLTTMEGSRLIKQTQL